MSSDVRLAIRQALVLDQANRRTGLPVSGDVFRERSRYTQASGSSVRLANFDVERVTERCPMPNPYAAASEGRGGDAAGSPPSRDLLIGLVLSLILAFLGGFLCGLAVNRFGETGSISLWLAGGVAGYLARKLLSQPRKNVGWMLAVANVFAFLAAEVCFVHWNFEKGAESLLAAIRLLPEFVQNYQLSVLIGGIFTVFGAMSAFRQAGVRYRLVPIAEN